MNMNLIKYLVALVVLAVLSACGGGGGSAGAINGGAGSGGAGSGGAGSGGTTVTALFVDAPANLTVATGGSGNTYTIFGGSKPYTVVSGNTAVATATAPAADGSFVIQGLSAGNASVAIKDAVGALVTISVTVPSPIALFSTAPSTLQILNGTSNFYTVYGGTSPYVVNTNGVIANAVINGSSLVISGRVPGNQTVAVSDVKGAVLLIDVTVKNGLYTDAPASLSVPSGTGATYTIYGGIPFVASSLYNVNSSNPAVASATVTGSTLSISGHSSGSVSLVITDSVSASTVITVTVPAAGALLSTAPSNLNIPIGVTLPPYAISGGNGSYTATSSNPALVTASATGSALTIGSVANTIGGTANVVVTDTSGTPPLTIVVTTAPVQFFTTAPSQLAIAFGAAKTFAVYGGTLPYTVVSTHPDVATGVISSGTTLTISGTMAGSGTVIVSDFKGVSVSITVAVNASGPLSVSAPSGGVIIASGSSNTYDIIGGVPPYRTSSSDLTIALPTIVNANQVRVGALGAGRATITVTDFAGTSVNVSVAVPGVPTSMLYTSAPVAGVFLASTDVISYAIFGGVPSYTVQSSNESVVHAVITSGGFQLQATGGGNADVLVQDNSGLSVTVPVTVGSANVLFVTAPTTLNMSVNTASVTPYQVSGGAKPYTATSSDTRVATGVLDPVTSKLTINALTVGAADLKITDALGTPYVIRVIVDNPAGTGTSSAATVDMLASSNTLNSTPGSTVSFIVTVKDGANAALPGQTVVFTASSGTLTGANPAPVTNAAGTVSTVTLSPGADASNRSITVTATTGGISKNIVIPVVGSTVSISGTGAVLVGSAPQNFTVKAVDSSGKPVVGAVLTIASALGNGLSTQTVTTDISGAGTVAFTATPGGIGADTLTVSGLGTSGTATVVVSNVNFSFVTTTLTAATWHVATPNEVRVRYLIGAAPQSGVTVNFSTTRGTLSAASAVTGVNGEAAVNVSSATAGPVTVSAQLASSSARTSVTGAFIAVTPATIVLQANPSALLPNAAGSTTNQSALTAVVRDAAFNPVPGVVVNFNAVADASGGSISPGSVTTDAGGMASAQFVAGPSSTANNGVWIQAALPASPGIAPADAFLTVNGSALFISIARSNTLTAFDSSTYQKDFSVYVTDATGAPAGNRTVTLSVRPTTYGKGVLQTSGSWGYEASAITPASSLACINEDANRNGILDAGEDFNGNARLDPGNPVVITSSVTTDALGFGTFTLRFGKNYAWWVSAQITAKTLVSGTESSQVQDYVLEMLSLDISNVLASPANMISPFGYGAAHPGVAISCSDLS